MPPNSTRTSSTVSNAKCSLPPGGPDANPYLEAAPGRQRPSSASRPTVSPGVLGDLLHREQHAGHERRTVVGVVADRQALPGRAEQHLLVRDHAPQPHRVHRDPARRGRRARPSATTVVVGSSPQSFEAAAMRCAVSIAVPDGASIFWSWCSSMISHAVEVRAPRARRSASSRSRRSRSWARSPRWPSNARSGRRSSASSASLNPVVPTTACTPCSAHHARFSRAASITVKSTATSAPASTQRARARRRPARAVPCTPS